MWDHFPVRMSRRVPAVLSLLTVTLVLTVVGPAVPSGAAEVDLDYAPLSFDYADHTNISPTTPDCTGSAACVGKSVGDMVRFNGVATVGGVVVDAAVTTTACTSASVTRYEVSSSWTSDNDYFRVRQDITAGGMCTFRFDFYVGGTWSGPGTGTPLTLRNVQLTALEIDNRQWVQFSDFDGYTLTTDTELTYDPTNKRFQSTNNDGSLDSAPFQVMVTFGALQSVTVGFGRQTSSDTNNFALAFQPLPFDGHDTVDHGTVIAETPDPIDEGTPAPEIGWTTEPPVDPSVWIVPPSCGVHARGDTSFATPLVGPLAAGVYVTHCSGGDSLSFVPTEYLDGVLIVRESVRPAFTG